MKFLAVLLPFAVFGCGDDSSSSSSGPSGERPVTDLGGVPYGATCEGDSECGGEVDSCCLGGKCSADGWCSPTCESDQDCPDGFYCISHSGTRCFVGCEDDRDCPDGFLCEDKDGHLTCRAK